MKIIVTGPNGFIAKNIVLSIKKSIKNIILLNHKSTKLPFLKKYKIFKFDLKKNIIPELSCDVLIHAATITPQKNYTDREYYITNFLSLKKLIKKIKIKKKIIFFSTTDIYKNQKKTNFLKENLNIDSKNISAYAKSKYKCENFLKSLNLNKYPFEKIILRLPGIVGKGNHKNFISNLVKNANLNKKLNYYGAENLFNNIYHIKSLTKLIKTLIKKKMSKKFEIINVGTNNPITINEIIQILLNKKDMNNQKSDKKNKKYMFTINIAKLNRYYKTKIDTKNLLKKYFKENLLKKKIK